MKDLFLFHIRLNTFEEEGATSENATGENTTTGEADQKIVYGKQDTATPDVETAENNPNEEDNTATEKGEADEEQGPTLEQEFEEMIKGKYKDLFTQRTQSIINKRFKETKTLEEENTNYKAQINQIEPILELLKQKYQVGDTTALVGRLEAETIEALAYDAGVDVNVYKQQLEQQRRIKALEDENSLIKTQHQDALVNQQRQERVAKWYQQEKEVQTIYPNFNLKEAASNNHFVELLNANIDVKTAYEVAFKDDIMKQVIAKAQENTVNNIKAKNNRPSENAASKKTSSNVMIKDNVSNLSKADREEIARRVARGEKITF